MGGDHKCPLCSATFTRPQHVGRHLRAHTGDRPYECKECPLRFARSDLLSRHVNKAHPKPTGANDSNKGDKKNRRKSVTSQSSQPPIAPPPPPPPPAPDVLNGAPAPAPNIPPAQNVPEHTPFQAQRMYPNHPLLQANNAWSYQFSLGAATVPPAGGLGSSFGSNPMLNSFGTTQAFGQYAAPPMRMTGSDQGAAPVYGTIATANPLSTMGFSFKKRACDQCNHSKVRCDCADPCARCAHRSIQCTYTKPHRTRNAAYPLPTLQNGQQAPQPSAMIGQHSAANLNLQRTGSPAIYSNDQQALNVPQVYQRRGLGSESSLGSELGFAGPQAPMSDLQWQSNRASQHSQSLPTHVNTTFAQQSPTSMGMALTPTLTNATSPTASDGADRRGSQNSIMLGNSWPQRVHTGSPESSMSFGSSLASSMHQSLDHNSLGSSLSSESLSFVWPPNVLGASVTTEPSALESEDGDTPPAVTKDGSLNERRRSSAGVWANALSQMRIDDPAAAAQAPQQNAVNEQIPFQLMQNANFMPGDVDRRPPSADLNLWKLFMDPMALQTPKPLFDFENAVSVETPRGLSKCNSMPDLTTPPTATAAYVSFPRPNEGVAVEGRGGDDNAGVHSEDAAMNNWKYHIQQRHASFSMHLDPSPRTNVTTQALTNATFASSSQNVRPPIHPLLQSSALQQTLAPERTPSFGSPMYEVSASNATPVALVKTPGGGFKTPGVKTPGDRRTPSKLQNMYSSVDRPGNKRQASQTLVPIGGQKRATFSLDNEDAIDSASDTSSRRGSTNPQNDAAHSSTPGMTAMPAHARHPMAAPQPPLFHSWQQGTDPTRVS